MIAEHPRGHALALLLIDVVNDFDFPGAESPEEDGATLAANARIKALAALEHTGLAAIADDTGLEVDALGGQPGIHAARYAGPEATYADNVRKLLAALADVAPERRSISRLRAQGTAIVDANGTPIQLRGVNLGGWMFHETWITGVD